MTTTFSGEAFEVLEAPLQVTVATLTKTRLRLSWIEGGYTGQLVADSTDGEVYEGPFTYHGYPNDLYSARLGVYRGSNGALLLYGEWWSSSQDKTPWLIQLVSQSK